MTDALLAWLQRGQAAIEAAQFADAVGAFAEANRLMPHDAGVALALANAQRLAGDNAGSRATLVAAQRQSPIRDASIGMRLGASLLEAGAPREAAAIFTRVMRLAPDDPAPIGALAGARRAAGDPAAAWTLIEQARAMAPDRPEFLLTAAQIRHELADIAGALTLLTRADAIRPHHAATQLQRAYSTLITGATHAGWALHEARPLPVPATNARAWTGQLLDQQSIVVTAEQGVGDQFQFARFIAPLAARGPSRVVVECHADAVSLFAASGFDAVARGAAPETEWHVPMLSLPHRLGLDEDVLPSAVPYLHAAPPDHGSKPDTRIVPLAPRGQRGLGVVWAGNPAFTGRATRDFDVSLLSSLLDVDGVQWFSLQFGDNHVAGSAGFERLARVPLSREWLQTASVLRQLDGLVTTDTGVAHLAGAMGIRCWVLLQHVPDWRWGLTGTTTPWYPTVRLVRQARPGDWAGVVSALHRELETFVAEPTS